MEDSFNRYAPPLINFQKTIKQKAWPARPVKAQAPCLSRQKNPKIKFNRYGYQLLSSGSAAFGIFGFGPPSPPIKIPEMFKSRPPKLSGMPGKAGSKSCQFLRSSGMNGSMILPTVSIIPAKRDLATLLPKPSVNGKNDKT